MPKSVGSVSVSVVPDASDFVPKLRAELEPGTKEIGEALGRKIGEAMRDSITPYIDEIKLKLDELATKEIRIKVKVEDTGDLTRTKAEIASVDSAAGAGGGGFNLFGSKIANIGILAISAADVAIPAILAIGAAAAGALAGVGVLALGFSGIGAALQAHGQKAPGGGTGVQGAQLGLQSARISADAATQSAQDQLTQATQAQTKAEVDLHLARVQALQDLQDLDNKLKDNTLSQVQAAINLRIAKQTLAVTLNAPGANQAQYANQVAQAQLNVATAQQKVNELTLTGTRLTAQDAKAHKDGVNNAPIVLAAQQALLNANRKLAEAQQNITTTAQKNAIALQQAALAMISAAAGANAFGQAMAKLNPIQQQFVEFLLKMKPLFDQIKLAASGFLPGLEQGIKNAAPAFGPILQIVGNIAKAMGSVFANIGAQFATPAGQKFLNFLSVELPKQIIFLGNLFISLGKIVAQIFEAAAPLIQAFDQALLGALGSFNKGGGLQSFFNSLIPLIKPLFGALAAVGGAIVSIMKALAPALPPVLNLITELANAISTLVSGPVGQLLVQTFIDLVHAVEPLVPLLLQGLQAVLPPIISLIDILVRDALGPLIKALSSAEQGGYLQALGKAFSALVVAVAPFLVQLVKGLIPIIPSLVQLLTDIVKSIIPVIPQFGQLLQALVPLIKPFADLVISLLQLTDKLLPLLLPLINPLIKLMPGLLSVMKPIVQVFADLAHWISEALDKLGKLKSLIPFQGQSFTSGQGSTGAPLPGFGPNGKPLNSKTGLPQKAGGGPLLAGMSYRVNEFGSEMFIPKVDGTLINAVQAGHYANNNNGSKTNNFTVYGQSDPVATAHQTANRFAARGV